MLKLKQFSEVFEFSTCLIKTFEEIFETLICQSAYREGLGNDVKAKVRLGYAGFFQPDLHVFGA